MWLLLLIPLFALGVEHDFWKPDEPREAEIAREIYVSGDWVVPRLNGQPFLEKPPLTHWGAALVFQALGGPSERWCRIPSAAWGLVGALAAGWLATMLAGRTVGILTAFILATNVEWAFNSRMLHVDTPLAAAVSLSLALFWYGYSAPGGARTRLGYLGCALALGTAFLAKGTVGLILPASVFIVFLLWRREWHEISRLISPLNVLAFAALIVPWLAMLYAREGIEALRVFIWDNQVLRFFSPTADHATAPWFYLEKLAELMVPWVILLPPALLRLAWPWGGEDREQRARLFILLAILVPFVILSAASGKRMRYLLPLTPAFSVAVAAWLPAAWEGSRTRWEAWWRGLVFGCAALLSAGTCCVSLYFTVEGGSGIIAAAIMTTLALIFTAVSVRHVVKTRGSHMAPLTVALVVIATAAILTPPLITRFIDSHRSFGDGLADIALAIGPGDSLYGYEVAEAEGSIIAFHRGSTFPVIETREDLARVLLESPSHVVYVTGEIYERLTAARALPAGTSVVMRREYPRGIALLLRWGGERRDAPPGKPTEP